MQRLMQTYIGEDNCIGCDVILLQSYREKSLALGGWELKNKIILDACENSTHCFMLFAVVQRGPVEGVIFADYGHDLWSGPNVPGKFFLVNLSDL